MTKGEIFTFILCLCVFLALVAFFTFLFIHIFKLNKKVIHSGVDDENLKEEYRKRRKKEECLICKIMNIAGTAALLLVMGAAFAGALYMKINENTVPTSMPNPVVCRSDSMKEKNKENTYLIENNLNNQFSTFDVLLIHKLPKEDELKLYDVVVYEYKDMMIIHRIIGIEEPNEKHPDERHFLLKGDANDSNDKFPVLYSQMKGIYKGEKMDCIGSFILFTQSPAGYLCIFLVICMCVVIPFVDRKVIIEENKRLINIGFLSEDDLKKVKYFKTK